MQFCLGEKNRGSGLAEDARPKGGSQFGAGSRVSGSLGKAQGGLFDAALCAPLRDDGVDGVRISSETVLGSRRCHGEGCPRLHDRKCQYEQKSAHKQSFRLPILIGLVWVQW
jgi:hypothetical protein